MADTIIENLITRFGFDVDQKALDKIDAGIASAVKSLTKMVVAAGAAATGLFFFTKSVALSIDKLGKFSQEIGVDVEALQELGFAAELNGASVDSMNSSLASLSRMASEAARGVGAGVEAFGILGISVTDAEGRLKKADDLLFDVSDSIARLNTQGEKLELASKLGIDASLILTIQKGSAALREQRREAASLGFIFDEKLAKDAAIFNDELLRAQRLIGSVRKKISKKLIAEGVPILQIFVKWLKANKELIKQNLAVFLDKVTKAFRVLFNIGVRVVSVIRWLIQVVGGLENSIKILGTAFLIMNAKALILPLTLAAAFVILALLIEDMKVFAKGGDSAFKKFNDWLDTFESLGRRKGFWEEIFRNPEQAKKNFQQDWWFISNFLERETALAAEHINQIWLWTTRFFENAWIDSINVVKKQLDLLPSLSDLTFGLLGGDDFGKKGPVFGEERGESLLERGRPKIPFSTAPQGGAPSRTTNNATTDNRTIQITVDGGDPNKILEIFEKVFNDKMTNARRNMTSPVIY